MLGFSALDGFIENGIRIKVIHDEDVVISSAGDKRGAPREISTDESFKVVQLECRHTDLVFAVSMQTCCFNWVVSNNRRMELFG